MCDTDFMAVCWKESCFFRKQCSRVHLSRIIFCFSWTFNVYFNLGVAKTSGTDTQPCAMRPLRIKSRVTLSLSLSMMVFVLHLSSSHAASEDHHINLYTNSFTCGVIHLPVVERTEGKSAFWASANWAEPQSAAMSCSIIFFLSSSKGSFQRRNWTPQAMLYLKGTRTLALYLIWLCDCMLS